MGMYERNMKMIERRLNAGLSMLRQYYRVTEIDTGAFENAGDGGSVGLKFNPVYNAQWKENGEWQQSYYAYPDEGFRFDGWYENDTKVSEEEILIDEYGTSRILKARFKTIL